MTVGTGRLLHVKLQDEFGDCAASVAFIGTTVDSVANSENETHGGTGSENVAKVPTLPPFEPEMGVGKLHVQ